MRQPRFVMTPSGRILTVADYKREQQQARDWARYEAMERANREWQDLVRGKERDKFGDLIDNDREV